MEHSQSNTAHGGKNHSVFVISKADPESVAASELMDELSDTLWAITGDSGRSSFDPADIKQPRSLFVIAYDNQQEALGCGAIRQVEGNSAEIKRMYARYKGAGIGSAILSYLELQAKELGYVSLKLETRLINHNAVCFYESNGYKRIGNYGKYAGNGEAVCYEKIID